MKQVLGNPANGKLSMNLSCDEATKTVYVN